MRSQNSWAPDIFHTFATHAGPVYDITDIEKRQKLLWVWVFFFKIHTPIDRPCGASSIWFPFKAGGCDSMK